MALNIITVSFNGQNETITKKRYQYDKGQVCVFDDIELPEAYKVIFSNDLTGENSIPMIGGENGVGVPDDFFLTGLTIYGWVYLSEGNDDGQTVKHFTIPVEKRVRETDEEPTPEEQTEIEQLIVALNGAVNTAETAAENAGNSALQAETAAEHYPIIEDGYWYVWDVDGGEYVSTGIKALGEDGTSPTVTVTAITGGHRVTITDVDGDHVFDVMDGTNGNGIQSITKTGTVGLVDTYTITYTNGQTTTFTVTNGSDATVTVDDALSPTSTNPVQNKVIDAEIGDLKADINQLQDTVDGILVEQTIGETVTLTNRNNAYDFYNFNSTGTGFKPKSYNDGVVSLTNNGEGSEKSPYTLQSTHFGSSTWLVGFKFKFTKLNGSLADPEQFRIHMGASTITDYTPVWNEWIEYANIATIDMTRIRIAARNFSSVPPSDSFKLEIKDLYVYDVSNVSADMRLLIIAQQNENYQDGTVTYGEVITITAPDTSLSMSGKAADSKAVGDAMKSLNGVKNAKEYGVTGDGTTDDTDAINALFALGGTFYFPEGTYKITGTIELPEGSVLYGDGDNTVIDMHDCVNLTSCTFRGGDKVYPYILARHDGVSMRDFKLIGNNTLKQQRHAGIGVLDAEKCSVEGITIYNINYAPTQDNDATVSGYGICVTRSSYINVERCHVQQCGYECIGIVDDCNYCVVKDCYTQDGWRTCIQVHRGSCNTTIENCYMKQTHTKYDACFTVHGLQDSLVKNLRVINCTAECTQNGAQTIDYCAPYQIMSYSECLVFIGNRASGGKRAFYITLDSTNAKIIGNDFQCNSSSDYGVTIGALNTIVVGNYLLNEASTPVNVISNNPVLSANVGIS